jgi:protein disulfide-isomerase A6
VIAKVDAEAPNSKATANDQGVSSYPTLKFFPKGSKEPVAYDGGRSEKDFVEYLNEKAGTHRAPGGGLTEKAGTVAVLDTVVAKFVDASSTLADATAAIKKEAVELKDKVEVKFSEYYVRVFDKLSKNEGYVAKEQKRLGGILSKGGLTAEKRDELTRKLNVLGKFVKKVEEEAKEAKEEL